MGADVLQLAMQDYRTRAAELSCTLSELVESGGLWQLNQALQGDEARRTVNRFVDEALQDNPLAAEDEDNSNGAR